MARGLAVAAAVVACLIAATPAGATHSVSVDCAGLQAARDGVDDDATITLLAGEVCTDAYILPSFAPPTISYTTWTLQGGAGAGFDGSALTGAERMLSGDDSHWVTIQNLTFRDGDVTGNGGAIELTGESRPFVTGSTFVNNNASGRGGAVHVAQDSAPPIGFNVGDSSLLSNTFGSETNPAEGNTAATGGAVSIESGSTGGAGLNLNTFANNKATGNGGAFDIVISQQSGQPANLGDNRVLNNTAGGSGGGGHVVGDGTVHVDNSLYQGNSLEPGPAPGPAADHFGGGLYTQGGLPRFRNNAFRNNAIETFSNGQDYGGGALAVVGDVLSVESEYTRIEGNTVAGQPDASPFESEGGGIFFSSDGGSWYAFLDAIAGNSVGPNGEGGGIYVGATGTSLELGEVTVAGNSVRAGGQFAGLAGGGDDNLTMRNSIVYNGQQPDIGGFDLFDIRYSDACNGGAAFTGPGNMCADPKLVGGTDIHQTKQSPTIDRGSDEFFDSEGGGERNEIDYEGDPRPTDGDGDGHTIDMGADETPAGFSTPPPPPPPPPPPAPQCSDQVDNDGDGAIDAADPGCLAGPADDNEGDETPGDLVLCGQRTISLVRADVAGKKVVLSGFVAASVAGQKVDLSVRYLGGGAKAQKLGSVTPAADGQFQARVKKPPRSLFNAARYRAQVGSAKSVELKLPQSLASSSLKQVGGGMLELRGQVERALVGKRNAVVVKRILCGQYATVGQAKPNRRGAYVVRFPAPVTGGSALYRAETRVLSRPGSKRYVKQFARAIGITF